MAEPAEADILSAIEPATATPNQLAAMLALATDIGLRRFRTSAVAILHRARQHTAAANAFSVWTRNLGRIDAELVKKREEQATLYLTAAAAPAPVPDQGEGGDAPAPKA